MKSKSTKRHEARAAAEARDKERKQERDKKKGLVTAKNGSMARKNGK